MFCPPLFESVSCNEFSARQLLLLPLVFTFQKARLLFFTQRNMLLKKCMIAGE